MGTTFAAYLSSGSGQVAYRLVIEGCPYEFVTDRVMQGALADGRARVPGLLFDGLSITERAILSSAELNVTLSSCQIVETPGTYQDAATAAFSGFTAASAITFIDSTCANVLSTDVTAQVKNAGPINIGDVLHVGTEAWKVTGITRSGSTAPDTLTITRGYWRTTAQSFYVSDARIDGTRAVVYKVSRAPQNYAGRRCWLYGHGTSELTTADTGTLLWRGILAANPDLTSSTTWSLSMQPRTALLDADIGPGIDGATKLRGIYYPARAPLYIGFNVRSGPNNSDTSTGSTYVYLAGFFETQEAFCAALATKINANATLAAAGGTWSVRPTVASVRGAFGWSWAGGWDLFYQTPSASPKWIDVQGGSPVDGVFKQVLQASSAITGSGAPVFTVAASTEYRCDWSAASGTWPPVSVPAEQCRQVPRACYEAWVGASPTASDLATWIDNYFFLDFVSGYVTAGTASLTPPTPSGSTSPPDPVSFDVTVYGSLGYIAPSSSVVLPRFSAAGSYQPSFELATRFGSATGTDLAGFMSAIVARAPDGANLGTCPFITSDDVADWTTEVAARSAGRPYLSARVYSFTKNKRLVDVIREECKLYGLFLRLDANGQIAVQRLTPRTDTPTATLDYTRHAIGTDDFGTLKLAPDGLITTIDVKSGYIPRDDKWSNTWTFRQAAVSTAKGKGQPLSIAPVVRPYAGDITVTDARDIVATVTALFGELYYVISVPVTMHLHSLRIGDGVTVTIPQLPYAGARAVHSAGAGLTNVRATVIGRTWNYGDEPRGTLDLLISGVPVAGYAPSARIAGASGAGASWTFTTSAAQYGDGSVNDSSYFAAGMRIVVVAVDAESPFLARGTVSSVGVNTIAVTLDAAIPTPSGTFDVIFDSTAYALTAAQKAYCYIADPTDRVTYADGTSAVARVFG